MRKLSRRDLLKLAGTGAVMSAVTQVVIPSGAMANDARTAAPATTRRGSVVDIGRRYVQLTPAESTRESLTPLLPAGALDGSGAIVWSAVAQSTGDDFARGDIVSIDGWRFSRTEARAAAFLAVSR
jgi:hypothetical protein